MGNGISSDVLFRTVCFDFRSTNVGSSVIGTLSTTGFDVITLQSLTLYYTVLTLFCLLKEKGKRNLIIQFVSFVLCLKTYKVKKTKNYLVMYQTMTKKLNPHSKRNFFSLIVLYNFLLILHTTFQMVHEIAKYATPMISCTKVNFFYYISILSSTFCPKPANEVHMCINIKQS